MARSHFKNVNSILLVSLTCIGDVILTTPVMRTLKDNFPKAHLTVVAGPTATPLLEKHEWVDDVVVFENRGRHAGLSGVTTLVGELRKRKYDMVVDLRNSAIPYLMRCRYRITAHQAHIKNKNVRGRHAIDRHLDVLVSCGLQATNREMFVTIPSETAEKAAERLKEAGLPDGNTIAVYPGAGSPYKLYPLEKFKAVLRMLRESVDSGFALVGSKEDRPLCEALAELPGVRAADFAGELDILETGALLKNCRLLITNDSGPMHLAAAVGTPTVAIFGPTDAERYGPRGANHRIIWRREPCNPCKSPECGRDSCIGEIEPETVVQAVRSLIDKNV